MTLIGTISGYSLEEIQYWVNSLDASGYTGDKVILACNAEHQVLRALRGHDYQVVTYGTEDFSGNAYYPTGAFKDEDASEERFRLMW